MLTCAVSYSELPRQAVRKLVAPVPRTGAVRRRVEAVIPRAAETSCSVESWLGGGAGGRSTTCIVPDVEARRG